MVSHENEEGQGVDPNQLANAYVHPVMTESNYIIGSKPGVSELAGTIPNQVLHILTTEYSPMWLSIHTTCLRNWVREWPSWA